MVYPFESSRRKIANAKKHIANLELEATSFWSRNNCAVIIEPDPQHPDQKIHKLRLINGIPDSFFDLTIDAISNLRSALDNAGYAVAVASGMVKPKNTAFPFAGSSIEFENGMKGRCADIPKEIHSLFRAYKPYKGGNDFLWALNGVSNADKHTLLGVGLGSALGNVQGDGGMVRVFLRPPWDRVKQEIEFGIFAADPAFPVKYEMNYTLFITFDEIEVVKGEPVLEGLDYFVRMVEHILDGIEAESRRLGFIS